MKDSLPNLVVAIVEFYKNNRATSYQGLIGQTRSVFESVSNSLLKNSDLNQDKICEQIVERLKQIKGIEDWLNFIVFLGKKAEAAQTLKHTNDQSQLCNTLHAIRDYILSEVRANSVDNQALERRIQALREEVSTLQKNIESCATTSTTDLHGRAWEGCNTDLNKCYVKLAYLGDKKSISTARQFKLLTYLHPLTDEIVAKIMDANLGENYNFAFPLCLQVNYFKFFYHYVMKPVLGKSLEDWEQSFQNKPPAKNTSPHSVWQDQPLVAVGANSSSLYSQNGKPSAPADSTQPQPPVEQKP